MVERVIFYTDEGWLAGEACRKELYAMQKWVWQIKNEEPTEPGEGDIVLAGKCRPGWNADLEGRGFVRHLTNDTSNYDLQRFLVKRRPEGLRRRAVVPHHEEQVELGKTSIGLVSCSGTVSIQGNVLAGASGILIPDTIINKLSTGSLYVEGEFFYIHVGAIPVQYARKQVLKRGCDLYVQGDHDL